MTFHQVIKNLLIGFQLVFILLLLADALFPGKTEKFMKRCLLVFAMLGSCTLIYSAGWLIKAQGSTWEAFVYYNRVMGPYWYHYWGLLLLNGILPALLFIGAIRNRKGVNGWVLFIILTNIFLEYAEIPQISGNYVYHPFNLWDYAGGAVMFLLATGLLMVGENLMGWLGSTLPKPEE